MSSASNAIGQKAPSTTRRIKTRGRSARIAHRFPRSESTEHHEVY